MDRKKIEIIVAVGLVVVFLVIILRPKKKKPSTKVNYEVQEIQGVEDVLNSISLIKSNKLDQTAIEQIEAHSEDERLGRDPFDILVQTNIIESEEATEDIEEPGEDVGPFPEIKVQGVVFAQGHPMDSVAIIDDDEFKIGDEIEGWEIILIKDELVLFKKGGTMHEVRLYEGS